LKHQDMSGSKATLACAIEVLNHAILVNKP
jgi:hypothetical protein